MTRGLRRLVEIMLKMNIWVLFILAVIGAVIFSVLLGLLLNAIFYDGTNNLLMLGAVFIPLLDAPLFIILLIVMIKELNASRAELDRRVRDRTAELKSTNDALKQEIADRESLQAQLLQAQKMESIGRLAGGVAHDFNNILSVIIGFSDLAMKQTLPDDPVYDDLVEIRRAAERSRDITRQLLAFARRETISPQVIDLNGSIDTMLKILKQLIGEDIDLIWRPDERSLPVLMDRAQLEQVLTNLCVNARDAIHDVGTIVIETTRMTIGDLYCTSSLDSVPGEYVMLSVSDTGHGMDAATMNNIFDPFFTTKSIEKGTGLGLATVHGITEQNGGFVHVYSEVGQGTTFRIYLPRYEGEDVPVVSAAMDIRSVDGKGEVILLVEDEESILKLVKKILSERGYTLLTAKSPSEALLSAREGGEHIDLLITDVVMPEMNGKELADRLGTLYPHLSCIFMSGYTNQIIEERGVLDKQMHLIPKPFPDSDIEKKVRAVLDASTKDNRVTT